MATTRKKTLKFHTLYGVVEVQERIWRSSSSSYHRLLPNLLGISHRGYTWELQRAVTDFGLDHSFAAARGKLIEHYGVELPVSSIRKCAEANAQRIAQESSKQEGSANCLPPDGVKQLVAEVDGSMVPFVYFEGKAADRRRNRKVEYREVRLCATQAAGRTCTNYRAGIGSPEQIGHIWKQCAKESGRGANSFVHAVGDGATWIEQQARCELNADRILLDFYHVCDYLGAAREHCASNGRWLTTQKNRLKRNRYDLVIAELASHLEAEHLPDQEAPARCAHRYLSNRTEQLDYKGARKQELPIGSGLIESGHKHVIQARMKIAGAAWSHDNADAFIQTRARRASGSWNCFWMN